MFNKYQNIFRSRWKAVMWAIGVCFTAYCTVPTPDGQEDPMVGALKTVAGVAHHKDPPKHVNPWALDKPHQG